MKALKSERLFLVEGKLPSLHGSPHLSIRLGCLAHDRSREVWIRQMGRKFELCLFSAPAMHAEPECLPIPRRHSNRYGSKQRHTESISSDTLCLMVTA
jgi:hypothetical protein